MVFDDLIAQNMLLENAVYGLSIDGVIPHAVWVNYHNGTRLADAQAVGFGAKYFGLQVESCDALFQVFPNFKAVLMIATFRLGLIGTEENVALYGRYV
jgi:hypothetical protein